MSEDRQAAFRRLFPAASDHVWFDTPGSPPGMRPVLDRMHSILDDWMSGEFDWIEWDAAADRARLAFAAMVGVEPARVAVMGSVAEAASTVARSLPPGRIVVSNEEFRSALWPFTALDPVRNPVVRVTARDGVVWTDDIVAAVDDRTVLVSVSEVLTSNGNRADLGALRDATRAVGARLFVDLTQSLGVLDTDLVDLDADFVAVHGYKWLACPRGAAWLVVEESRTAELEPLLPSWKSTSSRYGYFGGDAPTSRVVDRLDTSPAWFSWLGAEAALPVFAGLDRAAVASHALGLAQTIADGARELGCRVVEVERPSHIVVMHLPTPEMADAVTSSGVRCALSGDRLRIGVHYFNDSRDGRRLLEALASGR